MEPRLTFGDLDDESKPLAVLVHGFPDMPHTWRFLGPAHRRASRRAAGRRRVRRRRGWKGSRRGRDRDSAKFDLAWLIQRQCRDTARMVGLGDRGVLAPGYRADINVIDFDNLTARAPRLVADPPAGGQRVLQPADGYLHTLVRGIETYAGGEPTGALPGRLVRGARQPAT